MTRTPRIFVNERSAVRAPVTTSLSYYEQDPRWTEVKLAPPRRDRHRPGGAA